MALNIDFDDRGRLARLALAAALGLVAVTSFRKKHRLVGLLASLGAAGLGYAATTDATGSALPDLDDDTTSETTVEAESESVETASNADAGAGLHCAVCGESIVVGQSRRPNANGETVHDACL